MIIHDRDRRRTTSFRPSGRHVLGNIRREVVMLDAGSQNQESKIAADKRDEPLHQSRTSLHHRTPSARSPSLSAPYGTLPLLGARVCTCLCLRR